MTDAGGAVTGVARTLFIVDGHALAYRAFYAIPNLTSPDGRPTGAVLGFLRKILKVIREQKPAAIAVVFDPHGPTHRDEISTEYKATRSPMPDALRAQLAWITQIIPGLGLKMLQVEGFEADDVIATLTERAVAEDWIVEILSGDKDLAALVSDRVTLLAPSRELDQEKRLDAAGVAIKFGVPPTAIPDLLSLMGDSSDNIPGVAGIGGKTAAKLLQDYGSVEGVLAHLDDVTPRSRKALLENAGALEMSRRLVALKRDVELGPLNLDEDLSPRLTPEESVVTLLRELGFKSLVAEIEAEASNGTGGETRVPATASPAATSPRPVAEEEKPASRATASLVIPEPLILDAASVTGYLEKLATTELVAFDTETTSLIPHNAELVGVSFAADGLPPAYLPTWENNGVRRDLVEIVGRWLADPKAAKCGHHLKYDMQVLRGAGVEASGLVFDSLVADGVLNPGRRSHGLDTLAEELFSYETIKFSDITAGDGDRAPDFRIVPLADAARYAAEDAYLTLAFHRELAPQLKKCGLEKVYFEIEHPLIRVLADMEWKGFTVDIAMLEKIAEEFRSDLELLRWDAFRAAGREFNPDSPKQVGVVLFEDLALPARKKTKTGWSTDQETLELLADRHPLPRILLEYREVAKLLNTYVEALPSLVLPSTGRVHASFRQIGAATGRLSCTNPNLQNIPVRSPRGRRIREAFTAGKVSDTQPKRTLIAADYSQVEFRIAAWLAGEESLLAAFRDGRDLHAATAEKLFGVTAASDDVTKAEGRRRAKSVNFGILYGKSAFGLAQQLGISRREADTMIHDYFVAFPAIKSWIDRTIEESRARSGAETVFGRRRPLPELNAANKMTRAAAERVAINTPIQGTAADIIKIAMARLHERLAPHQASAMVLQVHDEVIIECFEKDALELIPVIENALRDVPILGEILAVNTGRGRTWLEASH